MSVSTDVEYLEARAEALAELRAARRRKRIQNLDKFEAFYKAYLTAVLSAVAMWAAAGWLGQEPVSASTLATVKADAPLYLGVVVAFVTAIGLRSGGRGGPLAMELADVRHVLLSPVDRRDSIRAMSMRALRHGAFVGACIGAAAGVVALRRLPGNPTEWVVGGIAFGASAIALGYATALIASGLRARAAFTDVLGLVCIGWAAAAAVTKIELSPFTWVGAIATAPLGFDVLSVVGLVVVLAAGVTAYRLAEGLSVETAERRSRLVGTLRFAATTQDIRTVMLLQRQLSQQTLRPKPWLRLRPPRKEPVTATIRVSLRRSLQSLLRWKVLRVLRLLALVAAAEACVVGIWAGTTGLVVPAGVLLWLAALDLVEPLAQDADRPDRIKGLNVDRGLLALRSVLLPIGVLVLLVAVPGAIVVAVSGSAVLRTLLPVVIPMVLCAVGAAALVVTKQASYGSNSAFVATPEISGLAFLWRVGMPPAMAVLGVVPVAVGHKAWSSTHDTLQVASSLNIPYAVALAAATWALLWLRFEDQMRAAFTPKPDAAKGDRK